MKLTIKVIISILVITILLPACSTSEQKAVSPRPFSEMHTSSGESSIDTIQGDVCVVQIGEQMIMDSGSEFERRLAKQGTTTNTIPGKVEFTINEAKAYADPSEAGISSDQLGEKCKADDKPSDKSRFVVLTCTLKNHDAHLIDKSGNSIPFTQFSANNYNLMVRAGSEFISIEGSGDGHAQLVQSSNMYFDSHPEIEKNQSNYYHIDLHQGESITYKVGFYLAEEALLQDIYYQYSTGSDSSPYYVHLSFSEEGEKMT